VHGAKCTDDGTPFTLSLPCGEQVRDNPCLKMEESGSSRYPTKKTEDVLHVLIRSRRIRDAIREQYGDRAPAVMAEIRKGYQGKEADRDDLQELISLVLSDAPVIDRYEAEGFYGEYFIDICGVKGAYYIRAGEGFEIGWFTTLAHARGYLPNCLPG
jgi:hypothetical protein